MILLGGVVNPSVFSAVYTAENPAPFTQGSLEVNNNEREEFVVLNPQELYYEIKKQFICKRNYQIDITSFYSTQRKLFLNCVLYFSLRNLSFDIMFPYIKDYCNEDNKESQSTSRKRRFHGALSVETFVPFSNENISL